MKYDNSKMNIGMFNDVSNEELYAVDGGSTKVAAVICYVGAGICAIGSAVASERGNKNAAAGWAGAGTLFASAGTTLSFIPAP